MPRKQRDIVRERISVQLKVRPFGAHRHDATVAFVVLILLTNPLMTDDGGGVCGFSLSFLTNN